MTNAISAVSATTKTTTSTKKANYTSEQTSALVAAYLGGQTKEQLSVTFGKSPRSIVAKLSREKVWQKAQYTTKQGGEVLSKEMLVSSIADIMQIDSGLLEGLEKANKNTLQLLMLALSEVAACNDAEENSAD